MITYVYRIEGEALTAREIIARLPKIKPDTVRHRLARGLRTWEALGKPPKQARYEMAVRILGRMAVGRRESAARTKRKE